MWDIPNGTRGAVLTAWPGADTALDNDQLQAFAFAAAHLGLGEPELSILVGAPMHRSTQHHTGTGWRKISDAVLDCRLQGSESLHRQLPRESRVLPSRRTARRPPRQDIPRGHPRIRAAPPSHTGNTPSRDARPHRRAASGRPSMLATGAWRDFHENKTARLPYYALRGPQHRVRTHASPPAGVGRTVESREKNRA
jgi:hypothetical protein